MAPNSPWLDPHSRYTDFCNPGSQLGTWILALRSDSVLENSLCDPGEAEPGGITSSSFSAMPPTPTPWHLILDLSLWINFNVICPLFPAKAWIASPRILISPGQGPVDPRESLVEGVCGIWWHKNKASVTKRPLHSLEPPNPTWGARVCLGFWVPYISQSVPSTPSPEALICHRGWFSNPSFLSPLEMCCINFSHLPLQNKSLPPLNCILLNMDEINMGLSPDFNT